MSIHQHTHEADETAPVTQGRIIRWAQHYDLLVRVFTLGREDGIRAETIQLAAIPSGATALDVGCGTGTLTLRTRAAVGEGGKVYGIDAAPEMIEVARRKSAQQSGIEFRVGLIEALPFADQTFDVVLSSLMFHHLPDALKQQGLKEIFRVLKPGGRLLIVDMKPAASFTEHITMMLFQHHAMTRGIQDVLPAMQHIGYTAVQTGRLRMKMLEYVSARRAA